MASYLAIARGRDIKIQPCWDDHHASDAYQWQPIEFLRGVYSNWWRQGADSVVTWNWSNATRKTCLKLGINPGPDSHDQGLQELGNLESMHLRDKMFALDRRGAFPWAEGFFNRNADARLPLRLTGGSGTGPSESQNRRAGGGRLIVSVPSSSGPCFLMPDRKRTSAPASTAAP